MGPKEKPKSKGQKNSELIRLLEDISNLKAKLGDTTVQIKEEKQINDRLVAESNARNEHVEMVDSQIEEEEEKHEWNKQCVMDTQTRKEESSYLRVKEIEEEEAELLAATAEHDFVTAQNVTLHSWLKQLVSQYETDRARREEEREVAMQKNFDIRMEMDQILRKTIRNFDNEYRLKAAVKMNEEAHVAKLDNARLIAEFARREETCGTLVRQQQLSFENMMRGKIELEVMQTSTQLQVDLVESLERKALEEDRYLEVLREQNEDLRRDIQRIREECQDGASQARELGLLEEDMKKVEERLPHLIPKVISFGRKVVQKAVDSLEKAREESAAHMSAEVSMLKDVENNVAIAEDSGVSRVLSEASVGNLVETSLDAPHPPEVIPADYSAIWSSSVGNDAHLSSHALRSVLKSNRLRSKQEGREEGVGARRSAGGRRRVSDNVASLTGTSYSFY